MSEYITHTAVFEDCARLSIMSAGVCEPFKTVLKQYWDIAGLGTLTRSGDKYTVQLLDYCRNEWPKRRQGDYLEEKLAYVIGWRCHNAADRHFKPIYREVEPEHYKNEAQQSGDPDERDVSDVRIYHDVVVFREVYDNGRRTPGISPFLVQDNLDGHVAARAVAVAPLETAIGGVIQRTLLNLQSFTRNEQNGNAWLGKFKKQLQDYYVDIHRYARETEQPQTDYLRRFALENHFYDRRDPLIRLARALQTGSPHSDIDLAKALDAAHTQSQYAQTLRQGYSYLLASSEFFERKIDEQELRHRLDLGTAHYKPLSGGNNQ